MTVPRSTLAKYIVSGCTFVETGTRWGDRMIAAYELGAAEVWSCETDRLMAALAEQHVADAIPMSRFSIAKQSSEKFLYQSAPSKGVFVVLLDAHTESHSPVLQELTMIRSHWTEVLPRVILIDDIRLMRGWGIQPCDIENLLCAMGYDVTNDLGREPGDVLVARRK